MTIIELIIILIAIGVGLYLLNSVVPIDGKIRLIVNVVVVFAVFVWVLEVFGIIGPFHLGGHIRAR